jgi:hypothetical protein
MRLAQYAKWTWLHGLTSLADSADLSRLKVRERQCWLRLPLKGKGLKVVQHLGNLGDQEIEGFLHENQLRIISNVAARCSIVNDASGSRGNLAEGMDVLG